MAQVCVWGLRRVYQGQQAALSEGVQAALVSALGLPARKRFHRFLLLDDADFLFPEDRSERYLIVEVSLFEGRSLETRRAFFRELAAQLQARVGLSAQDLEVTLFETPRASWFIRGQPGDELALSYEVRT